MWGSFFDALFLWAIFGKNWQGPARAFGANSWDIDLKTSPGSTILVLKKRNGHILDAQTLNSFSVQFVVLEDCLFFNREYTVLRILLCLIKWSNSYANVTAMASLLQVFTYSQVQHNQITFICIREYIHIKSYHTSKNIYKKHNNIITKNCHCELS